jgi:DNA-binding MarR family transcriptional regulator
MKLSDHPSELAIESGLKELSKRHPTIKVESLDIMIKFLKVAENLEQAREKHFARYGLSKARFMVLMMVYVFREGLSPSDIAEKMGVTRGNMTKLIDGVEAAGLIKRENDSEDRRIVKICLSAKGEALFDRILPNHFERVTGLLQEITEKDRVALGGCLAKLQRGLRFFLEVQPKK